MIFVVQGLIAGSIWKCPLVHYDFGRGGRRNVRLLHCNRPKIFAVKSLIFKTGFEV